jgi:hypothetical protein
MPRQPGTAGTGDGYGGEVHVIDTDNETTATEPTGSGDDIMVAAATVGVICVGAALFEAALIPGMVIGVAAMLVPRALPRLGAAVEPVFRGAVRGTYKLGQKARHTTGRIPGHCGYGSSAPEYPGSLLEVSDEARRAG